MHHYPLWTDWSQSLLLYYSRLQTKWWRVADRCASGCIWGRGNSIVCAALLKNACQVTKSPLQRLRSRLIELVWKELMVNQQINMFGRPFVLLLNTLSIVNWLNVMLTFDTYVIHLYIYISESVEMWKGVLIHRLHVLQCTFASIDQPDAFLLLNVQFLPQTCLVKTYKRMFVFPVELLYNQAPFPPPQTFQTD